MCDFVKCLKIQLFNFKKLTDLTDRIKLSTISFAQNFDLTLMSIFPVKTSVSVSQVY